jgi:hypothetical protein
MQQQPVLCLYKMLGWAVKRLLAARHLRCFPKISDHRKSSQIIADHRQSSAEGIWGILTLSGKHFGNFWD